MLMSFMTPLTLYLAIFNPVSDCGCFGDAWVLTNWETFIKNVLLLLAAIGAFKGRKMLVRFISQKMEWLVSLYTLFFVFTLSFYCLDRLPVLDFRPYKVGKNILEGMTMPEGAKPSVYESVFILEKNGENKEFTLENYPDSTWTFVDTHHNIYRHYNKLHPEIYIYQSPKSHMHRPDFVLKYSVLPPKVS